MTNPVPGALLLNWKSPAVTVAAKVPTEFDEWLSTTLPTDSTDRLETVIAADCVTASEALLPALSLSDPLGMVTGQQ